LKIGRRKFLGTGSAALIGLSLKSERKIEGSFVNEAAAAGHLLRDRYRWRRHFRIKRRLAPQKEGV
jgi:hypothetical protein